MMQANETPAYRKIKVVRIFDQVCDQLRQRILFGEYSNGEKLPTVLEFADQMGVSPTTIREALRILETERLIETRRGLGSFVTYNTIEKVPIDAYKDWLMQNNEKLSQVLQVRAPLEGMATALIAESATNEVITQLKQNMAAQEEYHLVFCAGPTDGDDLTAKMDQFNQLAYDFHKIICENNGNGFAKEIMREIMAFIFENGKAYLYACWRPCDSLQEHKEILKWIIAKDPKRAEKAMRAHIEHGCRYSMD